tara:strand:+ start:1589 stop:1810 length:222 start_codon:yes stop_codon:yes gene_type:complete
MLMMGACGILSLHICSVEGRQDDSHPVSVALLLYGISYPLQGVVGVAKEGGGVIADTIITVYALEYVCPNCCF